MRTLCQHTLIELHSCQSKSLQHSKSVRTNLMRAVKAGGGTIVESVFHNFSPYGVSGVVVITESHVTIHTWPEHDYAAVDIFSCSDRLNHSAIAASLKAALYAQRISKKTF